ncbi:MAG: family 43 glycosylhydrolase, partial [Armatimonadota bacterium]|nr:family 43 glycosylhydrolase [Armatimonadota bacterium]
MQFLMTRLHFFTGSLRLIAALALLAALMAARAAETDCLVRDPSTIVKRGDTYWIYGTGPGTQQFSSKDRIHWTNRGPALPNAPDWLAKTVPANRNDVWAPDIHFYHGTYYLYSAYSHWGTNNSGIGVATSKTLEPNSWVEQGLVVHSANGDGTNMNDIDPCVFEDAARALWLSYGSFNSGIKLVKLDPGTGKQSSDDPTAYAISSNGEASYVTFRDGYYYLFVNWGSCCAGSHSTYNIRMGRSRVVTGPYLDKSGKDMMQGGGTLFLGAVTDNGSGRPPDDEDGPGHVGILHDTDGDWLSTHYEWARDKKGATTVNVQRLAWDSDGWPRAVLDPGPFKIVSFLATHNVLTTAKGASPLLMEPDTHGKNQSWMLHFQGDGYYSIWDGDGKALSVAGDSTKPGAKVEFAPFRQRASQLWYLQQNDDGTYTLLSKNSGKTLALDVPDCSLNDGVPLGLWTAIG